MEPAAATATSRAGYLQSRLGGGLLALDHLPTAPGPTGVVLVPPWGWEETASYRARRELAERLCASRHVVLRIDLPATGDSAGSVGDDDFVLRSLAAVDAAADEVRSHPEVRRVVVVGFGLGGLLALAAAGGGAFEDLALWGAPASGRAAARRLRAVARLQTDRGPEDPAALPEGWLEAGGHVLSAASLRALAALDPAASGAGALQRILVLDGSGPAQDAGPAAPLAAPGVEVTLGDGAGYDALVEHPERVELPEAPVRALEDWLRAAPPPPDRVRLPTARRWTPQLRAGGVEEEPMTFDTPTGRLFGILTRPLAPAPRASAAAVFLNAGAIRRVGPHGLWTDAARQAASRGVSSLRLDLPGIGDAEGDPQRFRDVKAFYVPDRTDALRCVLDALTGVGLGTTFATVGLCSGGFYAFRLAEDDSRVIRAVCLNPGVLRWEPEVIGRLKAAKLRRIRSRAAWGRLLRGDIETAQVAHALRAVPRAAAAASLRSRSDDTGTVVGSLAALGRRGASVELAFSAEEPLEAVLRTEGVSAETATHFPALRFTRLPGRDHTLRPFGARQAALDVIQRTLTDVEPE